MLACKHFFRRKHSDTGEAMAQRAQISENQLMKKPRLELEKCKRVKSMSKKSKSQSIEMSSALSEDQTPTTDSTGGLLKPKGDALDRFWASIEPYCADITENELTMLQEGMRSVCSCLLYTSPSPRDATLSRMPSSA